jgi:hypothetical protein
MQRSAYNLTVGTKRQVRTSRHRRIGRHPTHDIAATFAVDTSSDIPIYVQLTQEVKHFIAIGAMQAGERLPSVREIAATLAVNRNTVARAYRNLRDEGIIFGARQE